MKDSKTLLVMFAVAILTAGAGFYGGIMFQKSKTPKVSPNGLATRNFNRTGGGQMPVPGSNGRMGGSMLRPVVGEILSKDDKSVTVKMQDGSSKIVMLSATTVINKAEKADASALIVGGTIRVFGTTNPDGSVTALDIQLNPEQLGQTQGQQPGQNPKGN